MKLVDILARELKEWPIKFGEFAISAPTDGTFAVWFNDRKPYPYKGGWADIGCVELWLEEDPEDRKTAIVTRAEWQAAVEDLITPSIATGLGLDIILEIPARERWKGEGLPPVGIDVEIYTDREFAHPYVKALHGLKVKVIAHDDECAVFALPNSHNSASHHSLVADCFRPIRTAERIAAEEREKAIKECAEFLGSIACDDWVAARELYDAGYRKQVKTCGS